MRKLVYQTKNGVKKTLAEAKATGDYKAVYVTIDSEKFLQDMRKAVK